MDKYFQSDLFNAGIRPAVNPGISASRGGNAQIKATKQVAGSLRLDLSHIGKWKHLLNLDLI